MYRIVKCPQEKEGTQRETRASCLYLLSFLFRNTGMETILQCFVSHSDGTSIMAHLLPSPHPKSLLPHYSACRSDVLGSLPTCRHFVLCFIWPQGFWAWNRRAYWVCVCVLGRYILTAASHHLVLCIVGEGSSNYCLQCTHAFEHMYITQVIRPSNSQWQILASGQHC